jgi:hypothetical protein
MRAYGGVDLKIHILLNSALAGSTWSVLGPDRFIPRERAPTTHWLGGWVDPRAGLDEVGKRKFLSLPGLTLDRSVVQPAVSLFTGYVIPAPVKAEMYL